MDTNVTIQKNVEKQPIQNVIYIIKKKNFFPVFARNAFAYDNHLILLKTPKKFKECNVLCEKKFCKVKSDGRTFS